MKVKLTLDGYMIVRSCPKIVQEFIVFYCGRYCKAQIVGKAVFYYGDMGDLYFMLFRLSQNFKFEIEREENESVL